ncbi:MULTISPECIES: translation initiation factor IF-3 [Spiroplasma]|uniref:Translation initiation factor IF-3 n=1 Tax=Spiroplasma cantharicola TaxID=362837 RepID=A0A0M5KED0_9MOLU|nr:translation initiation factor IF-3 [Spiroplasma cantharicola]ALD66126.1 translation initiation factor IF-3 [Spiroplasma cantharicola]
MADNKKIITDFVNREIRAKQILIINDDGTKNGPLNKFEALKLAEEAGLDLLQVGMQDSNTAIAKILDYGKFKYEQKRKQKENKKNQVKVENKEIRLTVGIGEHDLDTKARKAREFLLQGDRVKVSLKFKGREITFQEFGKETLDKFFTKIEDIAKVEKEAKLNTRFLDMYVVPKKG